MKKWVSILFAKRCVLIIPFPSEISKDFKDDASRVRAAFRWLTHNIRYDLEEYFEPRKVIEFRYGTEEERLQKLQEIKDKIVKEAFLTKMGVCEEYAQSFKKLMDLMNIEATVVKGYVRNSAYDIGRVPQTTNHAWNAVKIDNRWILLDATWAAGYLYNGKWVKDFKRTVSLQEIKDTPALKEMKVVQKGQRLSIQPVKAAEFKRVVKMGTS